jgi:2-oxoglutarate dehydrogenase E1 component
MLTPNSAYIDELYADYLHDPNSVGEDWRQYFMNRSRNGAEQQAAPAAQPVTEVVPTAPIAPAPIVVQAAQPAAEAKTPQVQQIPSKPAGTVLNLGPNDKPEQLNSIPARIAANMVNSLNVPTATSFRAVPVKALEENRRIINKHLARNRKNKVSFTHILAWGLVKCLIKYPSLNDTFTMIDGVPHRVRRSSINIGLAVDVTRKDGVRMLVVPSIKNAQNLTFSDFCHEYDALIQKARQNKLSVDELSGATISLTNPGTIGTVASVPRLMEGQGVIIATGAIEYPAEFQAVMPDVLSTLAISKVLNITSTYDHRIIQGAESGEFLAYLHKLLLGEEHFYDQIFANLHIPFEPMRWAVDKRINPFLPQDEFEKLDKEACVAQMINAYRVRGHFMADVNPLGLQSYYYPELDPSTYGFTLWDLDREFDTGGIGGINRAPLRDIIDMLRDTYCGKIGIEYMHVQDPVKKRFVQKWVEPTRFSHKFSRDERLHTYRHLSEAEQFEQYLHTKYLGSKRFSLEGGETTITFLEKTLELAAAGKMSGVVLGMAHRGRLNVLANILNKPYEKIFDEFEGNYDPDSFHGSGDVKYHLGASGEFVSRSGDSVYAVLAPNPSHLEAVNPVVEGMARAMDDLQGDSACTTHLPILVHGDAAFAGQGVVPETLNLSRLSGYRTGGTIHVIINNQIGFTTSPDDARSTPYATDIAKMLQVPILHVNGDDPEAVRLAAMFAYEYRTLFDEDVIVDIFCYRKYGHNETDEPSYTQPLLYKKIKAQTPVRQLYRQQLLEEKAFTAEELDAVIGQVKNELNTAYSDRNSPYANNHTINEGVDIFAPVHTAVSDETLRAIAQGISTLPAGFTANPKVIDLLARRGKMLDSTSPAIDWAMGEALAFGSLLLEGKHVRMSGQDCGRGTFSHRHAILRDYQTEDEIVLLNSLSPEQGKMWIYDSPLSEEAVLGFEFGYSTLLMNGITLWEAQFGDFTNGAQVVIDQFISSAEAKWGQISNLTLLLPHGYEGQGPEHSSARLERFLQLCAENNMFVCNFTTPAQYFHALRRQVVAPYRKPMIIMAPKEILRKPISVMDDLRVPSFRELLDDASIKDNASVERVIFCTGKIYYDLLAERNRLGSENSVALIRVEQLYPFHEKMAASILANYPAARSVVWAQEEPKNQGAWFFMAPRLAELITINQRLSYVGRPESASPATGFAKKHEYEKQQILKAAFSR